MARSQTGTVNLALTRLGTARRITSLDDGTELANIAAAVWDANLEEVLAAYPWNFAKVRVSLPADADAPAWGFAYAYTLPPECLRWIPEDEDGDPFPGKCEGRKLLTDLCPPLNTSFIGRIDDPAMWSPGFLSSLATRMAVDLAPAVTGDPDSKDGWYKIYLATLPEAKRLDGQETVPEDLTDNDYPWLDARL